MEAEALDVVAQFGERCCGRSSSQAGTHDNDVEFPLIGRVHQLHLQPIALPFLLQRAGGNFGVKFHSLVASGE